MSRVHGIRVDSSMSALEMASAGTRCALIPRRFAQSYLDVNRLVVPINQEMEIDQALYLLKPESTDHERPEAMLFRDWLINQRA